MTKSFSKFLSHVQSKKTASSNILLALKVSLEKIMLILCFQMVHVNASHHHFHLLALIPSVTPNICWRKCCFGLCGKTPTIFTQDNDSHHTGRILLQWKNKWPALSSMLLQKGQVLSSNSICRLLKFAFVGSLSLSSLHANAEILVGTLSFHSSSKAPSWISSDVSPAAHYKHF